MDSLLFKEGELVKIIGKEVEFRELQIGFGGWHNIMKILMDQEAIVADVINTSIRTIQFLGMRFNVNVKCLQRKDRFIFNREVRMIDDEENMKRLQVGHGEWNDRMRMFIGRNGFVKKICDNHDVIVSFGMQLLRLNPACLETEFDIMQRKEMATFIIAIHNGDLVKIKNMANSSIINKLCPHTHLSPLMIAAFSHQDEAVLKLLISSGANINRQYTDGNGLLYYVVLNKLHQHLDFLIDTPIDINIQNDARISPLILACQIDDEYAFNNLISHVDTNIHLQDKKGNTILHYAILNSRDSIITNLIDRGVSVTIENDNSFTPLHLLVAKRNLRILEKLLSNNQFLVNLQKTNDKYSGLHLAALYGFSDCLALLLKYGGDITARNNEEETALHIAVLKDFECVKLLCLKMSNINIQDKYGNSPLHKLVKKIPKKQFENTVRITEYLLKFGANTNLHNDKGLTPIEICSDKHVKEILVNHSKIISDQKSDVIESQIESLKVHHLCQICKENEEKLLTACRHGCCEICGLSHI